jgi:hypothetical protein
MLKRVGAVVVCALLMLSSAGAVSVPEVWNATGDYRIDYQNLRVYLQSAGAFRIQSKDGTELGDINGISIDPNVPDIKGTVNVYIVRDPNEVGGDPNQPGASNVRQIDLTRASEGIISTLRISDFLGDGGQTLAAAISGDVVVGKAIVSDVYVGTLSGGTLRATEMDADLHVTGPGPHTGSMQFVEVGNYGDRDKRDKRDSHPL